MALTHKQCIQFWEFLDKKLDQEILMEYQPKTKRLDRKKKKCKPK